MQAVTADRFFGFSWTALIPGAVQAGGLQLQVANPRVLQRAWNRPAATIKMRASRIAKNQEVKFLSNFRQLII
jgi:hypothetical protein